MKDNILTLEIIEKLKIDRDLLEVVYYRDITDEGHRLYSELDSLYRELRTDELKKMKSNPSAYSIDRVCMLIDAKVFTSDELIKEGLLLNGEIDRCPLPNLSQYYSEAIPSVAENSTDIFFWGLPQSGKTGLLMAMCAADGHNGWLLNIKKSWLAHALKQYYECGMTPFCCHGNSVINGVFFEKKNSKNIIKHHINLIEVSSQVFLHKIVPGGMPGLDDLAALLQNNNRKVFFILVDATSQTCTFPYFNGKYVQHMNISQNDYLRQLISFFTSPENQSIMRKVDAIHIIVSKVDRLGCDKQTQMYEAEALIKREYNQPLYELDCYCQRSRRINYLTKYKPNIYTFSLGKFYLGDRFEGDLTEIFFLKEELKKMTLGMKQKTWWDKFIDMIKQ